MGRREEAMAMDAYCKLANNKVGTQSSLAKGLFITDN